MGAGSVRLTEPGCVAPMRIVSLLPSATEIVCAIGLEDELVAVSHGCDWPPSVVGKPVVTTERPVREGARSGTLQDRVTDALHGGSSAYELDAGALAAVEPDLVLTQERCRVCAVRYPQVSEVVRGIDADITVVSLEPTSIEGIFNTISTVGAMTEAEDAAVDLVASLRERLGTIETQVAARRGDGHRAPRVVGLEWLDPPYAVGHWVPEQIRRAGGWELLGDEGGKATETTWESVAELAPEMIFLMPSGLHLTDTLREWRRTRVPSWVAETPAVERGAVVAVDGSAYFGRPGPRVIDGIELLAEVMDPAGFMDIAPPDGWTPVELP